MSITPEQCRAARALLDWSQPDLVKASGVARSTITRFERGSHKPHASNLAALRVTFEKAGVQFTDEGGVGVKMKG